MAKTVHEGLSEFSPSDTTYRLVSGVLGVIPGAPPLHPDPNIGAVGRRLGVNPKQFARAQRIAAEEAAIADILWMSALIDTGDKGYAIYTGVNRAVKMFWGADDDDKQAQPPKSRAYLMQRGEHYLRRYKELMLLRRERDLRAEERQELRYLQNEIRAEVERREKAGEPPLKSGGRRSAPGKGPLRPPSFPQGPARAQPPAFPGGPGGSPAAGRFGAAPAWTQQSDAPLGVEFEKKLGLSIDSSERGGSSRWDRGLAALETDAQQRNDAILKALALSYMAWRAFPGSVTSRAKRFASCPAGQSLLVYYGAIEVALPFSDNALLAAGNIVQGLFGDRIQTQFQRLMAMAGERRLGETTDMLDSLQGWMQTAVDTAAPYVETIAKGAQTYVPVGMSAVDKLAGLAANAADLMPCYRLLGARLAAEAAILRAMDEV